MFIFTRISKRAANDLTKVIIISPQISAELVDINLVEITRTITN